MNHKNVLLQDSNTQNLSLQDFQASIRSHLGSGDRLLSLFGSKSPNESETAPDLHAVFVNRKVGLIHLRGRLGGQRYQALTPAYSELHCFERELHEQYNLTIENHPWLKPIRFEGRNLRRMDDYKFYKLAGKEVHEVAVGPIHAGVIEPGHFRFMCFGEKVHHLEIHLGYQHRGAENLLRHAPVARVSPLIESVAGDTAVGYALGYCRAWEALCGIQVSSEVEVIRSVALELERIAMHLVGLGGLATDVAFLPGSSTYGRLRTTVINLSMRLCGSRFGRSWFRPGQLRFPFKQSHKEDIRKSLDLLTRDITPINRLFQNSRTVRHRLCTTGIVTQEIAKEIGMVGMAGRASGLRCDLRSELQGGAYAAQNIPLMVETSGDCWARGLVRIREIEASTKWILQAIDGLPDVEAEKPRTASPRANSEVVSFEEGWRGEVMHFIQTDANGSISNYKLQDPSIRNWFGLAQAVKDNAIYDFPICNKSFDLSYCGNDL